MGAFKASGYLRVQLAQMVDVAVWNSLGGFGIVLVRPFSYIIIYNNIYI